jgi:hypothetical protein
MDTVTESRMAIAMAVSFFFKLIVINILALN